MSERVASCCCGQLKVTVQGEPGRVSMCHCFACQKRTGSAFGIQARFPRDKAVIEGASTSYVRTGDSGMKITFHFCPTCGSTVFYEMPDRAPDFVAVTIGCFADPTFPPPVFSVYEARRHPWAVMPSLEVESLD